jgi:ABC-type multidrug transport system fused ATPase/permease subunit
MMGLSVPFSSKASRLGNGFHVVWIGMRLEPRLFSVAVLGGIAYGVGMAASGWVLGRLTHEVLMPAFAAGHLDGAELARWAGVLCGIAVVTAGGVLARRAVAGKVMHRLQSRYRRLLIRKYLDMPPSWHHRRPAGQLLAVATSDIEATWQVFAPLPMGVSVLAMIVTGGAALLAADLQLGAIGLALLPALVVLNWGYQRRAAPLAARVQALRGEVASVAQESFAGSHVVKSLGLEEFEAERFQRSVGTLRDASITVGRARVLFDTVIEGLAPLCVLAALAVGAVRVAGGDADVGDVVEVAYLIGMLALPVRSLGPVLGELIRAAAGWERLSAVLHDDDAMGYGDRRADGSGGVAISLRAVGYRYPDADGSAPPVLRDVNLEIPGGRTVAVVGSTGSGKSTFASLLVRLTDPTEGSVLFDGVDVRELSQRALADCALLVTQETFVLDDTVRNNVLFGADLSDGAVWEALEVVRLADFVSGLPSGLDTPVGEQGAILSGGQRQRLGLARAVIRSPRLLVLDDATSAVDPHVEGEILHRVCEAFQDTSLVLISNRMAAILVADEIVHLESGSVHDRGGHAEVLARSASYRRLVSAYARSAARDGQS